MEHRPRSHAVLSFVIAALLLVAGFVLLFIPGPGLPLIVFGLALLATHSKRLAHALDRAEPPVRTWGHRAILRWKAMSRAARAGLIASVVLVASVAVFASWRVAEACLH